MTTSDSDPAGRTIPLPAGISDEARMNYSSASFTGRDHFQETEPQTTANGTLATAIDNRHLEEVPDGQMQRSPTRHSDESKGPPFKRIFNTRNPKGSKKRLGPSQSSNSTDQKDTSPERNTLQKLRDVGSVGHFAMVKDDFQTRGKLSKTSGRLNLSFKENGPGYLAKTFGASLQYYLHPPRAKNRSETSKGSNIGEDHPEIRPGMLRRVKTASGLLDLAQESVPKLNIVIMIIGSRGDVQPFLKIGKLLKEEHGHRVRIATHPAFKDFVEKEIGLDFFSIGGDPAELMAFMVKNPGLIPSISAIRAGEIGRKRESMYEMFQGFWRACISPSDEATDGSGNHKKAHARPFVADAIIANPPSFAHIHCAERLGIPLHIMFTFPYTPTQRFPHPLANIQSTNVDAGYTNFMSYLFVEMMTWSLGLGDLLNRFRVKTLGLEPISTIWSPGQLYRLKVPHTYMWSPGLIPKPVDWGPEIELAGFVFLDLATNFSPPKELVDFLNGGEPPVYIGFGSIVVDDPDKFTALIFEAVAKVGVRALVSKGWGGLGDKDNTPDQIYMLENTPHDWLFPRVSAVVHHGGAGTTAIGLKCGKPTMIVPFFGDQPFWGSMVAKAGAGAEAPVPYKKLNVEALADGIKQCLSPEAQANAAKLAESIEKEGDGAKNAIDSFHRHLPLTGEHSMRCSILHDRVAVWALKNSIIRLSALAAELLVAKKKVTWKDLRLARHCDWNEYDGPGEPLTGAGQAAASSAANALRGIGSMPRRWSKCIKDNHQHRWSQKTHGNDIGPNSTTAGDEAMGKESDIRHSSPDDADSAVEEESESYQLQKQDSVHLRIPLDAMNGQPPQDLQKYLGDKFPTVSSQASSENISTDLAAHDQSAFGEVGEAIIKAPVDLLHAIALGFHNAPRLYGDTVRSAPRISGIQSGLKAAVREFSFGIYDGVTGVVLQPYQGAKEHGLMGFVEGMGKGVGGLVIKSLTATVAPLGYTLKGMERELSKSSQPTAYIRHVRMTQGALDLRVADFRGHLVDVGKVEAAWKVIVEVRNEIDALKAKGLKGRLEIRRENKRLQREGAFENVESVEHALRERRARAWLEKQASSTGSQGSCENCGPGDKTWGTQSATQGGRHRATDVEAEETRPKKHRSTSKFWFGRKSVIARQRAQDDAEDAHAKWAIRQRAKAIEAIGGESAARAIIDAVMEEDERKGAIQDQRDQEERSRSDGTQARVKGVSAATGEEEMEQMALDVLTKKSSVSGLDPDDAKETINRIQAAQESREQAYTMGQQQQEQGDVHRSSRPRRGTPSISQPPPLSTSSSTTTPPSDLPTDADTPVPDRHKVALEFSEPPPAHSSTSNPAKSYSPNEGRKRASPVE